MRYLWFLVYIMFFGQITCVIESQRSQRHNNGCQLTQSVCFKGVVYHRSHTHVHSVNFTYHIKLRGRFSFCDTSPETWEA